MMIICILLIKDRWSLLFFLTFCQSFVLPGNCMCLCVCKCLFFILLHGMRIQTFWLALTTTQKKYIDISNFSNKTLGSEQNPFFFCRPCDFSVLFEVWEPEKTIISSIGKSLFQDQKMEFEHLLFKREAEEGEDKEEKKEVGKLWKIYSHTIHNSISIFHPQSIIKKVEHELEKDVNLVAEKTHMKPWWVKLTKRVKRCNVDFSTLYWNSKCWRGKVALEKLCSRVPSEFWAG